MKKEPHLKNNVYKPIPRGTFTAASAKIYILIIITAFHVLPLILAILGKTSDAYFNSVIMFYFDPIIIFGVLFVYGIKTGFNLKMPISAALLSAASTIMYYNGENNTEMGILYYPLITFALAAVVYGITSFLGIIGGAFIRRFKIL